MENGGHHEYGEQSRLFQREKIQVAEGQFLDAYSHPNGITAVLDTDENISVLQTVPGAEALLGKEYCIVERAEVPRTKESKASLKIRPSGSSYNEYLYILRRKRKNKRKADPKN